MSDRAMIAQQTAAALRAFASSAARARVLIGFDGFVDSIIHVVDKRENDSLYQPIHTITQLGQRITAAAGQSTNFELVTILKKLGGNGPIMANAMAAAGVGVTYVGSVGYHEINPAFEELARRAEVLPVAEPGTTDALEFSDGKLLMGKYDHLTTLDYAHICQAIGEERFHQAIAGSRLIGMLNWTMLPGTETVWQAMIDRVLPAVGAEIDGQRRIAFIDLCDPEKRPQAELKRALALCAKLNEHVDVVLGVNLKESRQVAAAMGVAVNGDPEAAIESTARGLREALGLHAVVVHPRRGAAAALRCGDRVESATFYGPFTHTPKLSTGAGDNFNAGFCLGLLAGLPVDQALCTGTATSGYYVRNAASPSLAQLADFCATLPEPEA